MMSPWLILPLIFTFAQALSVPRHPENWIGSPEGPTCEQLRAFWEVISRTTKMGHITNEIPILPLEAFSSLDRLTMGSRRKGGNQIRQFANIPQDTFSNQLDATYPFPDQQLFKLQQPIQLDSMIPLEPIPFVSLQPEPPSDQDVLGMFGEFHEPPVIPNPPQTDPEIFGYGSSSIVPLNSKGNDESQFYGSPENVGTFGPFVGYDVEWHRAMTRTPKNSVQELSDVSQSITSRQKSSQEACDTLVNTDCSVSEQCACRGLKLICKHGKCLNHELNSDIAELYGTWHNGPIPQSQLRLLTRLRKRSRKSIFM